MITLEVLLMLSIITAGIMCCISDFRRGIIPNRLLLMFLGIGVSLSGLYYGFFAQDLFISFIWNIVIVAIVAILLFFTKSFAGGDTKMCIVLAILFPARFYFTYSGSSKTLVFAVMFAIFLGYAYLAALGIYSLLCKHTVLKTSSMKGYLKRFALLYLTVLPYVTLLGMIVQIVSEKWLPINPLFVYALCFALAMLIAKTSFFKKLYAIIPALVIVLVLSIYRKTIPISLDWKGYLLIFVTLVVQMIVSRITYQSISTEKVLKGMVLSTASSMLMQSSKMQGMPPISSENLGDRLSEVEAEKVRIWGRSLGQEVEVSIVRKIPFAIFIVLGFMAYFIIWLVLV